LRRSALSLNGGPGVSHEPVPITHAISYMRDNWTCFLCHNFGFGLLAFVTYGYSAWVPTFFGRVFGWTPAEAGVWFGVTVMVFGSLGILFGGYLADRLLHHGYRDAKMRVGFFAAVCSIPFGALFPIASSAMVSLALLAAATFILAMPFGVAPAAIQEMMPSSMRGQASAIYLFVVNLIGMGLGPSAVAWFTDYVFQNEAMVGRSLLAVNMIGAISAALLLGFGLAHFRTSIQYLEAWHARAETTASPSLEAAETASAEA
ncbi:MAG: MFS transporter, partial [Candidatus Hydrogenedentes bacterium]|nr:MFS transporter [Candidatus Hydrogenedentota bacterium]